MSNCTICTKSRLGYVLNNKLVCLSCDELTFDLEIESDEEPTVRFDRSVGTEPKSIATLSMTLKK